MLRKIYYLAPPNFRFLLRELYYFQIDFYEGITGKRGENIPKSGDIYTGNGDFVGAGEKQVRHLKKYIGLQPTDKVLDIGSGIGRTAIALTKTLDKTGAYEGFDAVEKGVNWCTKNLTSKFPNFNFKYIPLRNSLYNTSKTDPSTFAFPYDVDTFDNAFLFSVFTHMKIDEIQNYLNEINRVLIPGGKCLATFFTYSEGDDLENNKGFKFPVKKDGYRLLDEKVEEANIAIEMETLKKMISQSGLTFEKKIAGFWSDFTKDKKEIDFQDIIILKK